MSRSERLALVDHDDQVVSVVAQCRLLKVARSSLYYRPAPVSADAFPTRPPQPSGRIRAMMSRIGAQTQVVCGS